jgi:hypothetical protein
MLEAAFGNPSPSANVAPEKAHTLAQFGSPDVAPLGLYRVHWKSGGSSLAAIGMMENGDRWIAPTNWIRPGTMASAGEWGEIERLEPIEPPLENHMDIPKRWLVEETFPSGSVRWQVVEHENHARRLGETLKAIVTPLYDHPPSPQTKAN